MSNLSYIDGYSVDQIVNDAWLNVVVKENTLFNPFDLQPQETVDRPELYYSWLLTRPEYLGFACKILLNVELSPFQAVILRELWTHKFPMLVATRGAGKAQPLDTPILTDSGWVNMGDITLDHKVYGRDGNLYNIKGIFPQGQKQLCNIYFEDGRSAQCCDEHLWTVLHKGEEKVVTTKDIIYNGCWEYKIPMNDAIHYNSSFPFSTVLKHLPAKYMLGPVESRKKLLRGLIRYYGTKGHPILFKNKKLEEDVIHVCRSLGIFCKKSVDGLKIYASWPLLNNLKHFVEIKHVGYSPEYVDMQCISVDSPDSTYITKDYVVTHNTFMLAVYSLLRALLIPNRKVVIVGSVFRQSKLVFGYIKTIYDNSPILRSIIDDEPHFQNDRCFINIGSSKITALPVGNTGDKIRGERSSEILVDEFACLGVTSIVQTDHGLIKIKDYLDGKPYSLLNKDREFEYPDTIFRTPKVDVYRVTTTGGYSFDCSEIHQFMTRDGWKKLKEAEVGDWLELDQNNYFPDRYIEEDGITLDENLGWLMGALVSEGTVTNRNYIAITSTDMKYLDKCKEMYPSEKWKMYTRKAHTDGRGWKCKEKYQLQLNGVKLRLALEEMGLGYRKSREKTIPSAILQSPKSVVVSFLAALMEGDGSCFEYEDKGKKRVGLSYYSGSEELIRELHILLLKFGIFGSIVKRKSSLSENIQWMISIRGKYAKRFYDLIKVDKFEDRIKDSSFHVYKPFIREVTKKTTRYYLSTYRGNKSIHLGSFGSREDALKYFHEYENNSPIMVKIKSIEKLPEKEVLYDFHMPKTHSFIANGFVQHNSQSKEIFETVIAGFGAVSSDPINEVKLRASQKFANLLGLDLEEEKDEYSSIGNQIVLSGTAYYHFNHFAQYWEKWRSIIKSKGDPDKLSSIFGDQEVDDNFDWRDYSIIRLPADLLPTGFMDSSQLARSKATLSSDVYSLEFSACFSKDSNGFFKASLLEKCTANEENDITHNEERIVFEPKLRGESGKQYVFGVDPASERDRFAIVVLEIHQTHRRIVHCWTTNSQEFKEKRKAGLIDQNDFYGYTARKIRDLMILFPCMHLAIDSQGGGKAVYEALHDESKMLEGELPLWEIIDENKIKDTDGEEGLHIVELVNFASAEYTSYANHSMKKDFEDKTLLFPRFNPAAAAVAASLSEASGPSIYDTLEDNIEEIEELKRELAQIIVSKTPSGRERWDTPDIKISSTVKGRLRKDRYSALLMANAAGRKYCGPGYIPKHDVMRLFSSQESKVGFIGPSWITSQLNNLY